MSNLTSHLTNTSLSFIAISLQTEGLKLHKIRNHSKGNSLVLLRVVLSYTAAASREFARQLPIVVVEMLPYHKMPDNGCYFVLQRLINQRPEGAAAEQKQRGGEAKPAA